MCDVHATTSWFVLQFVDVILLRTTSNTKIKTKRAFSAPAKMRKRILSVRLTDDSERESVTRIAAFNAIKLWLRTPFLFSFVRELLWTLPQPCQELFGDTKTAPGIDCCPNRCRPSSESISRPASLCKEDACLMSNSYSHQWKQRI